MNFDHDIDMDGGEPSVTFDWKFGVQCRVWDEEGAFTLRWHDPHDAERVLVEWLKGVRAALAQESMAFVAKPHPDGVALRLAQTPPSPQELAGRIIEHDPELLDALNAALAEKDAKR